MLSFLLVCVSALYVPVVYAAGELYVVTQQYRDVPGKGMFLNRFASDGHNGSLQQINTHPIPLDALGYPEIVATNGTHGFFISTGGTHPFFASKLAVVELSNGEFSEYTPEGLSSQGQVLGVHRADEEGKEMVLWAETTPPSPPTPFILHLGSVVSDAPEEAVGVWSPEMGVGNCTSIGGAQFLDIDTDEITAVCAYVGVPDQVHVLKRGQVGVVRSYGPITASGTAVSRTVCVDDQGVPIVLSSDPHQGDDDGNKVFGHDFLFRYNGTAFDPVFRIERNFDHLHLYTCARDPTTKAISFYLFVDNDPQDPSTPFQLDVITFAKGIIVSKNTYNVPKPGELDIHTMFIN